MNPVMKRVLALIVALVTVFAVSQTVIAKQASAHGTGWGWCTGSTICTAKDQSGGGNHSFLNTSIGFCRSMPYNDEVTSVDSHFGVQVNFWRDAGCNGGRYTVAAWGQVNNLGGTGFNDTFSSYCVGANTPSQCGPFFP